MMELSFYADKHISLATRNWPPRSRISTPVLLSKQKLITAILQFSFWALSQEKGEYGHKKKLELVDFKKDV